MPGQSLYKLTFSELVLSGYKMLAAIPIILLLGISRNCIALKNVRIGKTGLKYFSIGLYISVGVCLHQRKI